MRAALALAAGLAVAAGPAGADPSPLHLDLTDPAHQSDRHWPPLEGQPIPSPTVMIGSHAVYILPNGFGALAQPDWGLSRLCREGAFIQKVDRYFWARVGDINQGVAFSTGGSLDDPQKRAQNGRVYFFENQDGDCVVRVGMLSKLMPYYHPK